VDPSEQPSIGSIWPRTRTCARLLRHMREAFVRRFGVLTASTGLTDIQVYFCDLQNPWQRGTNENTSSLLRQYLPKGIDISHYSQAPSSMRSRDS
jgi:hypothetical protein